MAYQTDQIVKPVYRISVPGSCGELVQGSLSGQPFLVTSPIAQYAIIEFYTKNQVEMLPLLPKSLQALEATLQYCQGPSLKRYLQEWTIKRENTLPVGKGMASSSADLAGIIAGSALTLGISLEPCEIAQLALAIEPTDGVFFPGIVQFNHVTGNFCQSLGMPPKISIAVFDGGGEVDTLKFNCRPDLGRLNREKEEQVRQSLYWVKRGIAQNRPDYLAYGATLSAQANQKILYKPALAELLAIGQEKGALGVCAAHSGTVLGLMFSNKTVQELERSVQHILKYSSKIEWLGQTELIGGGLKIERN